MYADLLEVNNLSAYYMVQPPIKAVDGVTLSLGENEILGIAGESGCGKSTFALALLRLLRPPGNINGGDIIFNGVSILKMPENDFRKIRWKHISYIPQSSMNALNPVMRIQEQFTEIINFHEGRKSKKELKIRIEEALAKVNLAPDILNMYPHELSGGMKQRVIIAMAMLLNPEIIIADEPTTALDVVMQRKILQLLLDAKQVYGSSMIIITHDMAVHAQISDKIAVMYAGKVVCIGETGMLFDKPLHPYAQILISAIPSIKKTGELPSIPGLPPDPRNPPSGCRFHPRCPSFIKNKCDVEEPSLIEVKKNMLVACHLYG